MCFIRLFFFGDCLVIVLFDDAAELFAACGAKEIFGVELAIKANCLAAGGAYDLAVIVVTAIATVASGAVTVAPIFFVLFPILAVAFAFFVEVIFNVLQIVVKLFNVFVEVVQILVDLLDILLNACDLVCHFVYEVEESGNDLALFGLLVELETFC